jgi:hypothetical protein
MGRSPQSQYFFKVSASARMDFKNGFPQHNGKGVVLEKRRGVVKLQPGLKFIKP